MTGVAWVLDIERSRWNDTLESQFTVNCGVFIAGVTSLYFNRPERLRVGTIDCCIHVRLGMLAADRLDKWWKLRVDDDVAAADQRIGKELAERLTQHVFPFFDHFQNPDQVLQFLTRPRTMKEEQIWPPAGAIAFCYAAALASLLERPQDVAECFRNAIKASQGSPIEEGVLSMRDRIQLQ